MCLSIDLLYTMLNGIEPKSSWVLAYSISFNLHSPPGSSIHLSQLAHYWLFRENLPFNSLTCVVVGKGRRGNTLWFVWLSLRQLLDLRSIYFPNVPFPEAGCCILLCLSSMYEGCVPYQFCYHPFAFVKYESLSIYCYSWFFFSTDRQWDKCWEAFPQWLFLSRQQWAKLARCSPSELLYLVSLSVEENSFN